MNTAEFLMVTSAIAPERAAIVFEDKKYSYADLQERSSRLANALTAMGLQKGDTLAFLEVNCNHCVETYFACAKLGMVYVPLNFRAKSDELAYMIQDSDAKVLIAGQRYTKLAQELRSQIPGVQHYVSLGGAAKGMMAYEEMLQGASADDPFTEIADEDLTILMFTAGTTGLPKGVMLAHRNFSEYVLNNVTPADPETEEKNILTVPLYHIAGVQAMMASVYGGRTLVVQRQFEAEEWMRLVREQRVDRAMMVPTMLKQLMDHPKFHDYDLSSLKVITYGAAPMPVEVIKRAIRELPGTRFINAFGQTESAATITMLGPEDHVIEGSPEEIERRLKRLSSIGKPLADVEVRIMGEDGSMVASGQVGEIVARGGRIMRGYWKQDSATTKTIDAQGWLHTGDLGYQDEDGYIFLAGRAKDIIKRGGEMISPEEVENVILSHPNVEDAAVIGVADDTWGERVRAVIVTKNGAKVPPEEIIELCRQRLASFKKPESVVFTSEIPRNPMGKILKRVLREQFNEPITVTG